ncbi:hypothetical protein [Dokdonia sp.]|uniref:hypothetical protein n=1 Tax=Dokdonia sp. TaxID=2024995 RepID=UPI0032637BFB
MLSSIKKFFGIKEEPPLNPAIFNHPLAEKTSWEPLKHGGSSHKNVNLIKVDNNTLEYKPNTVSKVFTYLFLVGPILFLVIRHFVFKNDDNNSEVLFLLVPIAMTIGGAVTTYFLHRPHKFDKKLGYHYKSYKNPTSKRDIQSSHGWTLLSSVEGIQIIKERVKTKNSSYKSYEINLVLENGSRKNVIDHGNYEAVKKNAKTIADFLGVPYWDAISLYAYTPTTTRTQHQDTDQPYDSTRRFRDM